MEFREHQLELTSAFLVAVHVELEIIQEVAPAAATDDLNHRVSVQEFHNPSLGFW